MKAKSNCCSALVQSAGEISLEVDETLEDYVCSVCWEPCEIFNDELVIDEEI